SLPDCSPATNTLKHHLQADIAHRAGDAADRFRISALWDALLCHLDAGKLPFDGECPNGLYPSGTDTVKKALESVCQIQAEHIGYTKACNTGIYKDKTVTTVADVLALLCKIKASEIAYEKPSDCTRLSGVTTVQGAIDQLCKAEVGDSCCVTVGDGTPFPTIGAAIEQLVVDRGRRDLCLCLRPGFYEEDSIKLAVPDLRLKIAGSGKATRIVMKGPWQFGELAFFQLKDVELASTGVDEPLQFMACREVDIQSCGIEGRFTKGALLTLEKAERIGLRHCQLVAEEPDTRNRASGIFSKLLDAGGTSATRKARDAVLPLYASSNRFEFETQVAKAANVMAKLDGTGRNRLQPVSRDVLKKAEDTRSLEAGELGLYREVVSLMVREDSNREAMIARHLNEIRLAAAATADMTAVALMDGLADTRITDCRIYGNIGLYGTATKPSLSNSQIKQLGASMRERAVRFPANNGRLRVSASTIRRIRLSKGGYDRLKDVAAGKEADFSDIFSGFTLSENVFGANQSWLLSGVLTHTGNDFDFELKQPEDTLLATAVNADAIYTGNRSPDASVFDSTGQIRNMGYRKSETAANMMLQILD
ncbi:MAG: hypothetical protein QNJ02_02155, partial [Desulfobacterales bacterium]|nr:hypothetical protein [Desulfobacterales bacterium]